MIWKIGSPQVQKVPIWSHANLIYWLIKVNTSFDEIKYLVANRIKHFVFISIWYWGDIEILPGCRVLCSSDVWCQNQGFHYVGTLGAFTSVRINYRKVRRKNIAKCFYGLINLNTSFMVVCPALKRMLRFIKPSLFVIILLIWTPRFRGRCRQLWESSWLFCLLFSSRKRSKQQ